MHRRRHRCHRPHHRCRHHRPRHRCRRRHHLHTGPRCMRSAVGGVATSTRNLRTLHMNARVLACLVRICSYAFTTGSLLMYCRCFNNSSALVLTLVLTRPRVRSTRYMDCCKPSCSWDANAPAGRRTRSCDSSGITAHPNPNAPSSCSWNAGMGSAFTCFDNAPWTVRQIRCAHPSIAFLRICQLASQLASASASCISSPTRLLCRDCVWCDVHFLSVWFTVLVVGSE